MLLAELPTDHSLPVRQRLCKRGDELAAASTSLEYDEDTGQAAGLTDPLGELLDLGFLENIYTPNLQPPLQRVPALHQLHLPLYRRLLHVRADYLVL